MKLRAIQQTQIVVIRTTFKGYNLFHMIPCNSEDVFRCERAIEALEKMMNSFQDITNRLSEKRKNCYLPSLDLGAGGKSKVRYVEVKLQALEEIKGTLVYFFTCWTMSILYFLPYVEDMTKILTQRLKK